MHNLSSTYEKVWKEIRECIQNFDRYRVLGQKQDGKGENDAFVNDIAELLKYIASCFYEECEKKGIWLIINYYSLFLDKRCKVLKNTETTNFEIQEIYSNVISWYKLFGSLNIDINLLVTKQNCSRKENNKNYIPLYLDLNQPDLLIDQLSSIYNNLYQNLSKEEQKRIDNIREILSVGNLNNSESFNQEILKGWEKECIVFSSTYKNVDFSESIYNYPNILFFKTMGALKDEDFKLCEYLKDLYVDITTHFLILENDILLDRLKDLVDSKPTRIFNKSKMEEIKRTDDEKKYGEKVSFIFKDFIEKNLIVNHPIIKNDLLIAFYIYWTKYFDASEEGKYLDYIIYWTHSDFKECVSVWREKYQAKIKELKDSGNKFDFKELVFDTIGEKSAVEIKNLDKKDFLEELRKTENDDEEFLQLNITNKDCLSADKELAYYMNTKKTLNKILDSICEDNDKKGNLVNKINDGKFPTEYFSLFYGEEIEKTGYRYIYYIPSVNYDGSSYGGFSFFCKNAWPRSITKAAEAWATRFGSTFAEIEGRKIAREREAKKSLEREIQKERMFSHIYKPVFTGMELTLRAMQTEGNEKKDYIAILKNQVNALFLINNIRQRMRKFNLEDYTTSLRRKRIKTNKVALRSIIENILYIHLFTLDIDKEIAKYMIRKSYKINKDFNVNNYKEILFEERSFLKDKYFKKQLLKDIDVPKDIKILIPENGSSATDYVGFIFIVLLGVIDNFIEHPSHFNSTKYLRIKHFEENNGSRSISICYHPENFDIDSGIKYAEYKIDDNEGIGLKVFNDFLEQSGCRFHHRSQRIEQGAGRSKVTYKLYEQKISLTDKNTLFVFEQGD